MTFEHLVAKSPEVVSGSRVHSTHDEVFSRPVLLLFYPPSPRFFAATNACNQNNSFDDGGACDRTNTL